MSRTKIVCTIGPATSSDEALRELMQAGMSVARLNFSHGTHDSHRELATRIRRIADEEGRPVAVLQDLSGPKLRIGKFAEGRVYLMPGAEFTLTTREMHGGVNTVQVELEELPLLAKDAERILLADGMIQLDVESVEGQDVHTTVRVGGYLSDRQGISIPGRGIDLASMTDKDREDLKVGLEMDVDYIALSFVRSHKDILTLRELVDKAGSHAKIIAKLERPESLEDLQQILECSDGVMVARGDLGIEIPPEKVPIAQKRIISEARRLNKYVITATQMLESMVRNARPTRAEASDVANAVLDGTDAVMLSAETATGEWPVRSVEMMTRIAAEAESSGMYVPERRRVRGAGTYSIAESISWGAAELAAMSGAKVICAFTQSGLNGRLISKTRPAVPVLAMTPYEYVMRQLSLAWGVTPVKVPNVTNLAGMMEIVEGVVIEQKLAFRGDNVLVVSGFPFNTSGKTNLIKLHRIGSL